MCGGGKAMNANSTQPASWLALTFCVSGKCGGSLYKVKPKIERP